MCVVSNIGDDWNRNFPNRYPWFPTDPDPSYSPGVSNTDLQLQINQLRKDMEALKELLKAATKYDQETGQPDCHIDEKVEMIKKIAKMVGVDFSEVFPDNK